MAVSLASSLMWLPPHSRHVFRAPPFFSTGSSSLLFLLTRCSETSSSTPRCLPASRVSSHSEDGTDNGSTGPGLLDGGLLRRVASARDADQVLEVIAECRPGDGIGVVGTDECCSIIEAALERNNTDLALSMFSAMRSSYGEGFLGPFACQRHENGGTREALSRVKWHLKADGLGEEGSCVGRWKWGRPDLRTYGLLVRGLARALKVSDAFRIIANVSRAGISSGEEVPFGKIVRCPTCMIAIAVAQPQHGTQVASCSKCRYQYELVSGNIVSIDSKQTSIEASAWEKGLKFLRIINKDFPAAIHSIVVRTPAGTARTHRFATKTVELPAQEGERVTVTLASAAKISRGPLKVNPRPPQFSPGEPMCLTNHTNGRESELLRAPDAAGKTFLLNPSFLFPAFALLATGDAASGIIDPSLPRFISIVAITSVAVGATINRAILPQLSQLPKRMVDVIAHKQQLLSQYDLVQNRIRGLVKAAEEEVWMLARMCQLENKIVAVGEPSYRARRERVKRVRESLENSIMGRIELIESYAKISSMIEIEVELDSDVLAAEAVSNAESIAEQIQQAMEIENLEERWQIQAEANDEVERLLTSQPMPMERV